MPVGTASVPHPSSIMIEEIRRPRSVFGVMSPKPTVVSVVIAQYTDVGMLVKPFSGPSTMYIRVPMISTIISTASRNTMILRRLATSARPSDWYSHRYAVSLRTRKMRSRRSIRTSISACASGTSSARYVGSTESRSTMPKKLVA